MRIGMASSIAFLYNSPIKRNAMIKMSQYSSELYANLLEGLSQIRKISDNSLQEAEQSTKAILGSLENLKSFVLDYSFADIQEEIIFFKETKPLFLKELIYHKELYTIESLLPIGEKQTVLNYYKQQLERAQLYFLSHRELYNYYKLGKTYNDAIYFVRDAEPPNDDPLSDSIEIDKRFCTKQSYVLSKLQAFELLSDYLQKEIYGLEHPIISPDGTEKKFANRWTDSIVALIELVYALHARGSINNGKGSIKQIMSDFERVFQVNAGNFHRTFQNMRIRKKEPTPFLNALSESLKHKMDEYQ